MKKKLISAMLALAIVAAPSLGFVENTDSLTPSCQITASAAQAKNGWCKEGGNWYYYINGKKAKKQWITSKGKKYYLKKDGVMATGWEKISGYWYYFDTVNGDMYVSRWLESPKKNQLSDWYYLGSDGKMYEQRKLFYKGYWYFFDKGGKMVRNRKMQINNEWWYFDGEGHGSKL